ATAALAGHRGRAWPRTAGRGAGGRAVPTSDARRRPTGSTEPKPATRRRGHFGTSGLAPRGSRAWRAAPRGTPARHPRPVRLVEESPTPGSARGASPRSKGEKGRHELHPRQSTPCLEGLAGLLDDGRLRPRLPLLLVFLAAVGSRKDDAHEILV